MGAEPTEGVRAAADGSLLRGYLSGRDCACPGCGYNLRDLSGERCPECGRWLTLTVEGARRKQGAALLALIGLASGAGVFGYWTAASVVWMLWYLLAGRFGADFWVIRLVTMVVPTIAAPLFLGSIVWLWCGWERFLTMSLGRRKWVAGLCLVAPAVVYVVATVVSRVAWQML